MKNRRTTGVILGLAVALAALFTASLCIGSVKIPAGHVWQVLTGRGADASETSIILQIRLPRAILSMVLGGALALSGFLLQTYFGNPIAGPFILGISSGSKLTVALLMVAVMNAAGTLSSFGMIAAAFAGAMLVMLFILLIARRVNGMASLLVAGIMVGYICSALTDFVVTFADDSDIVNLHNWSQGSFSGANMAQVLPATLTVAGCLTCAIFLAKPISALMLGEHYAASMGVNVRVFRVLLILISSVLSATVAAFAGPISFVGVAVPYLIQMLLKTSRPQLVIPVTFLGGALFCLGADLIARTIFAPTELNISTVTAVLGAPVVIVMMVTEREEK
ncbi:MAG: iron ABC transporter permease [Lachnospiraceae bacterium]|nr:iron ABC transporter permease [Lachnospiraceae bacterium]